MSVDVTNPDTAPVRVRPRSRGDQSVTPSHEVPTLLRVPDVRLPAHVAALESRLPVDAAVATAPPAGEAVAAHTGEVYNETSRASRDAETSTDGLEGERGPEATAKISTLAKLTAKTADAVSRCAKKWGKQLRTLGAITTAIIACTFAARAMKQDDFDAGAVKKLMAESTEAALDTSVSQQDTEVINVDVSDDVIAADTSNNAAGPDTKAASGMSHSVQGAAHADSLYPNSPPFANASGRTQNSQRPSAPAHTTLETTLPAESPRTGATSNVMETRFFDQRRWASSTSPTNRQTRFALTQSLPHSALVDSPASSHTSELAPEVTPVDPAEVWPTQRQIPADSEHTGMPTSTQAPYPSSATGGSPQLPRGYPTTDPSRYGSFDDLKTALIERRLKRYRASRVGGSRTFVPTRNPSAATRGTGTFEPEAIHNRGGAYR